MRTHKNFTGYRNKPYDSGSAKLNTNEGIYFVKNYSKKPYPPTLFFLYTDGSVQSVYGFNFSDIDEEKFWDNPHEYMRTMRMNVIGSSPGHYTIRKNEIRIQVFSINPGHFFVNNSLELQGYIKNDSSIVLTGESCNWCNGSRPDYPKNGKLEYGEVEYKLFKTNIRPDSSRIWFKEKNWYKKNVWSNRE